MRRSVKRIGVFDSGVGGTSIAAAIRRALPGYEVVLRQDAENLPYGTKPPALLKNLVLPILKELEVEGCQVIVIACNTVTTTLIDDLRTVLSVSLVGIEPMIKPAAAASKSKVIAVCATPTTLDSPRYRELKDRYAQSVRVLEPDCSDWALMIEHNQVDHEVVRQRITAACEQGADVIVLGCTHYHWIEEEVTAVARRHKAIVMQPEQPVIAQLKRALSQPV